MVQGHFEDSDWLSATSSPSLCPQSLHALPHLFSFVQTPEVYQGLGETGKGRTQHGALRTVLFLLNCPRNSRLYSRVLPHCVGAFRGSWPEAYLSPSL